MTILTNKPKDIPDGWHTDDKDIDQNKQDQGNGHMSWPAEGLTWEEQLLEGSADLQPRKGRTGQDSHVPLGCDPVCLTLSQILDSYPALYASSLSDQVSVPLPREHMCPSIF